MTKSLEIRGHGERVGAAKLGTEAPFDIGNLLLTGLNISVVVEGDVVPREFTPWLLSLHPQRLFPLDQLIKKYPFEDINQAFADSADGSTLKPVIVF